MLTEGNEHPRGRVDEVDYELFVRLPFLQTEPQSLITSNNTPEAYWTERALGQVTNALGGARCRSRSRPGTGLPGQYPWPDQETSPSPPYSETTFPFPALRETRWRSPTAPSPHFSCRRENSLWRSFLLPEASLRAASESDTYPGDFPQCRTCK